MNKKTGVLIINLGSPSNLSVSAIRAFLREFLMDKCVIDLPWLARALIVYGLVLPFRPQRLVSQYKEIWLEQGSPLVVYSQSATDKLAQQLGDDYEVRLAMRYGQPSMQGAISELLQQDLKQLVVIPFYPQYATSTTGSTVAELYRLLSEHSNVPSVEVVMSFYDEPGFIAAQAAVCRSTMDSFKPDHLLMSYHGLPVSHIKKEQRLPYDVCMQHQPCPSVSNHNSHCYRAHCYETSRLLAAQLGLTGDQYTTTFQSRFGKNKWIEPVTTEVLQQLAKQGVKKLAVTMPSFVVDCLETLEEIAIRAKEAWIEAGGEDMVVIPCLNDNPQWVSVLADWVRAKALTEIKDSCNVT
ncbi:MAG: ferrochelatase [Coxiellaceae bacterium]|nr:ferrochelatase [Coxiellaceae bacterium]